MGKGEGEEMGRRWKRWRVEDVDEGRRGRERIEIVRETDRRKVEGKGGRRRVSRGDVYQNNKILFFFFFTFSFPFIAAFEIS